MADAGNRLIIPVIALAEACRVVEKRKSTIPTVADLLAAMDADARMSVEKLDRELLERSLSLLSVPEMQDRLIVTTAIQQRERHPSTSLVTADSVIRASGLVPTR